MNNVVLEPTQEEIKQSYESAMESVYLLDAGQPITMTDEDWLNCVKRNKEHLNLQIAKGSDYYGDLDLTPFENAIK
jgi:hypothetical protein